MTTQAWTPERVDAYTADGALQTTYPNIEAARADVRRLACRIAVERPNVELVDIRLWRYRTLVERRVWAGVPEKSIIEKSIIREDGLDTVFVEVNTDPGDLRAIQKFGVGR